MRSKGDLGSRLRPIRVAKVGRAGALHPVEICYVKVLLSEPELNLWVCRG